ncbi:MAG: methyltransferase type 12 [Acidimicrobiales bacterium]|nr:methyltransferase type 12 [Acidimicrobiales bacterium]
MSAVCVVFALGLVLSALARRLRLSGLTALVSPGPAGSVWDPEWLLASAAGVEVDEATVAAAVTHAEARGLEVLDLVPGDLPVAQVLELAGAVDTTRYRADRFATGAGAGQATLIRRPVLERIGPPGLGPDLSNLDPVAYASLLRELKLVASDATDLAIAPRMRARPPTIADQRRLLEARTSAPTLVGSALPAVLAGRAAGVAVAAAGLWLRPIAGIAVVAAYCAQPAIVIAGRGLRPADGVRATALRWLVGPIRLARLAVTGFARRGTDVGRDAGFGDRRAVYDKLLAEGTEGFFEPRRATCPWCGAGALRRVLRTRDLFQHKPGAFTLDRCLRCSHVFQNPRLSEDGLDFYYLDFYDGLGEELMDGVFATTVHSYEARVALLGSVATPERWLDVGGGHGHFCAVARDRWPEATFEGLDLGDTVWKAVRRGWIDAAHQGMFPELAPSLAGRYDVVSMHHYLEHTTDPRAELDAAAIALRVGGHLLIEQPDPEFGLRRVLRSAWLPYFQPQHLHLARVGNIVAALEERGFTVVAEERGAAHQGGDLAFAVFLLLSRLSRPPDLPWRPPGGRLHRVWHGSLLTALLPFLALAALADRVVAVPLARRARHGNAYRLVARLDDAPAV